MNILFLTRLFYPHIGGVEKHILEVSKILHNSKHKVTVVTEQYDNGLKQKETYKGIDIVRIPISKNEKLKKMYIWWFFLRNVKLLTKSDIIHAHDVYYYIVPFRIFLRLKNTFVTFHGYEGNSIPSQKSILLHKISELLSKGNICIGKYLTKWYNTKADYISYGAIKSSSTTAKKMQNIKGKRNHIVFVGRLEEETGIRTYLKALKILKDNKQNFTLTALGDGSLMSFCKTYTQKNNLNITYKGFVKDVMPHIHDSSIVFTSRYLGIMEALSAKKTIFSVYNNKIMKDVLYLTPYSKWINIAKNEEQLSKQILTSLKNSSSTKKSTEEGYNWVKDQTWQKMTNTYINLWKKAKK